MNAMVTAFYFPNTKKMHKDNQNWKSSLPKILHFDFN